MLLISDDIFVSGTTLDILPNHSMSLQSNEIKSCNMYTRREFALTCSFPFTFRIRYFNIKVSLKKILSHVLVTKDTVWTGELIYWIFIH
jgi:hypothetical protein